MTSNRNRGERNWEDNSHEHALPDYVWEAIGSPRQETEPNTPTTTIKFRLGLDRAHEARFGECLEFLVLVYGVQPCIRRYRGGHIQVTIPNTPRQLDAGVRVACWLYNVPAPTKINIRH